jgi:hypothetical protein
MVLVPIEPVAPRMVTLRSPGAGTVLGRKTPALIRSP